MPPVYKYVEYYSWGTRVSIKKEARGLGISIFGLCTFFKWNDEDLEYPVRRRNQRTITSRGGLLVSFTIDEEFPFCVHEARGGLMNKKLTYG